MDKDKGAEDPNAPLAPRGRARGRGVREALASGLPVPAPGTAEYQRMFTERREGGHDVLSEDDSNGGGSPNGSGNGNGGHSSGDENGNGNGNGHDDNGNGNGNGNGDRERIARGGIPRGGAMVGRSGGNGGDGNGDEEILYSMDYVPTRPDGFVKQGTSGQEVRLLANYFMIRRRPTFEMLLYHVAVEPPLDDIRKVKFLIRAKKEELGNYLLTGLKYFSTTRLAEEKLVFNGNLRDDPTTYIVKLEFKRQVGVGEPLVLHFHNSLVRIMQEELQYKLLGRHFFDPNQKIAYPSWRLELWPGFQNSIRQQESGLMLNVESAWKVVLTETVLQKLGEIRNQSVSGPEFQNQGQEYVRSLMIVTKYNNMTYKLSEIDFVKNPSHTFKRTRRLPNGTKEEYEQTYVDYYLEKYNIKIQQLGQPLLVSKATKRDIRRGQIDDKLLVPELCYPCGLNESLRGNFRLMKDLASNLHMEPGKRVQTMKDFLRKVNANDKVRSTLLEWGMKVNENPVEINNARKLDPVEIIVGDGRKLKPDENEDWTSGLRNQKMLTSIGLRQWIILVTARDHDGVGNLVATLKRVGTPFGYQIANPQTTRMNDGRAESFQKCIEEAVTNARGKLDMIFVILPNNNLDVYSRVKQHCTKRYGIPSQCFLSKTMGNQRGLMSVCTKVVIQMNAKQGGEPWGLSNPMKTAMVLGYDVHHAGQGGGGMSVAAMTATMTPSLGKYYSTIDKLQADKQEVSTLVAKMFERCLNAYKKQNSKFPDRIFMYRDGVGEGQLPEVYNSELKGFQAKIETLYKEAGQPAPKLTYIIVNKRICTRFVEVARGQNFQNPKPGTVVDDIVTRPERYDFFLVSQIARQGCVSPTYYNVIHDESGLKAEQVQLFTWKLCHLYFNWSGTVSVPAPCQYAHKFAFQAGTALKQPAHADLSYLLHYL